MVMLEISNFLHFAGLILGVGGATIANILSIKADKDPDIAKAARKIAPTIVKLIWIGLVLLIISGIMLPYYMTWPMNTQMLMAKHILVVWIVIIGILIGVNSKKLKALTPLGKEKPSSKFLRIKKMVRVLSIVNLILWWLVTLQSVFV